MLPSPGLYVHLPWCVRKCPYCDFNSHEARQEVPEDAYIEALLTDLQDQVTRFAPPAFGSVFFGGGTPSLFSAPRIEKVLAMAERLAGFTENVEITLEANPGAAEYDSFRQYRNAGVNRISLGVQSFDDHSLQRIGRIHSSGDAKKAVEAVHNSGINQLNLDLMYGLPEQTVQMSRDDIDQAINLEPTHISHYNLTIEPNTYFAVHTPELPDDDCCFEMQTQNQTVLADAGYFQYEISAYARTGQTSRHNLNYWQFGDYLGIGAGAHGKITGHNCVQRTLKARHPDQYQRDPAALTLTDSDNHELLFEFMLNRLRLPEPISVDDITRQTGVAPAHLAARLELARSRGLMEKNTDTQWQTTRLGWRFLNDLQQIFLP